MLFTNERVFEGLIFIKGAHINLHWLSLVKTHIGTDQGIMISNPF